MTILDVLCFIVFCLSQCCIDLSAHLKLKLVPSSSTVLHELHHDDNISVYARHTCNLSSFKMVNISYLESSKILGIILHFISNSNMYFVLICFYYFIMIKILSTFIHYAFLKMICEYYVYILYICA